VHLAPDRQPHQHLITEFLQAVVYKLNWVSPLPAIKATSSLPVGLTVNAKSSTFIRNSQLTSAEFAMADPADRYIDRAQFYVPRDTK